MTEALVASIVQAWPIYLAGATVLLASGPAAAPNTRRQPASRWRPLAALERADPDTQQRKSNG